MSNKYDPASRADQVRARRHIEPVQRKQIPTASQRVSRDAQNSSRVVSRNKPYATSHSTYSATSSKRKRIYMQTGTPGSEIRLPSLPNLKVGWRMVSAILAVGMLILVYVMLNTELFRVNDENLHISGNFRVTKAEIMSLLSVTGDSILYVMPDQVESDILASFPDIRSASVSIRMPAELDVIVEERIPAILWLKDEDPLYWLDQDGYSFTVRGEATLPIQVHSNSEPPHPYGYEPAGEQAEAQEKIGPAVAPEFVLAVQKLQGIMPGGTYLLHDEDRGLGWIDPTHGWQVYFGDDIESIDLKLAEYQVIVEAILEKNLQPILISMEFLHAPYYRLEH